MVEAGEKEAKRLGVPMVIAITDAGAHLLAFGRMDETMLFSINAAMDKAFAAAMGKLPSYWWSEEFQKSGFAPIFLHERFITLPGGFPIIRDGVILGGVGVSGGTVEDLPVAKAVLEAGGFSTEDVDKAMAVDAEIQNT
jgi:uncharacterized protein GlcG (DUF336 family)